MEHRRLAGRFSALVHSATGQKAMAGISGLVLSSFLVVHVAGLLVLFGGADAFNDYAAGLHAAGPLLWAVRVALLGALVAHVLATFALWRRARRARGQYCAPSSRARVTTSALRVGGPLLLLFVIFHVLHMSVGAFHPTFEAHDVYGNVVNGLAQPTASACYAGAALLVGLHLFHNRLGASALMQTLADGYFIVPSAVGDYLASAELEPVTCLSDEVRDAAAGARAHIARLFAIRGTRSARSLHRELGEVLWKKCGLSRSRAGLTEALSDLERLRAAFWNDLRITGEPEELNQELERAGRVSDFIELGQLMCRDALSREESCGCHFREEHQTADGEAARDDERYSHVAVWRLRSGESEPVRGVEPLHFENTAPTQRSYR